MQHVISRRATASDAALLPEVERSAADAFRTAEGLEWVADDTVISERVQAVWIARDCVWVAANAEGDVLGFIIAEGVSDVLHVWELAVRLDAQRSGIGTRLMKQAEDDAIEKNARALTLTTFRELSFNEKFYTKLGFKVVESVDLDARLRNILKAESANGLASERRCAMYKELSDRAVT